MPFGFFEDEPTANERAQAAARASLIAAGTQTALALPAISKLKDLFGNLSDESIVKVPIRDLRPREEYYNPDHPLSGALNAQAFNDLTLLDNAEISELQKIMGTDVKVRIATNPLGDHSSLQLYGPFQGKDYDSKGYVALSDRAGSSRPPAPGKYYGDHGISKAIALHEMGHSTGNLPTASLGRRLVRRAMIPSKILSAVSPLGAAFIDPNDKAEIAAALGVQSLLQAPILTEEFIASRKAFEGLDKLKALNRLSDSALDEGKNLLRAAYKTYAGGAAGNVLGTGLALGLANDEIRSKLNPFD
jgi:hypothetical protein